VKNFRIRYPKSPTTAVPGAQQKPPNGWRRHLSRTWIRPYISEAILWAKAIRGYPRAYRMASDFSTGAYSLVHINNTFPYNVEALIAARYAGIPAVGHARNPIEANLFNKWALRMTCGVATVNQRLQRQLSAWTPSLPIQICYDGVALTAVDIDSVNKLRNSLPSFAKILICSAGRLDQQKGYVYLVQAARHVLDVRSDVLFAIAGDGPLRSQLEHQISDLRISDQFHLLGFRQDIQNVIAASDLFVSSSLWEGLPIVAVESTMLAKPLVLTNVGGSSEVVIEGKNGYVVPAANAEALAKAILTALENLSALAEGAREVGPTLTAPMDVRASAGVLDEFFERVAKSK
jgi:glycosyltransferase involved in cell wall biosynthesis